VVARRQDSPPKFIEITYSLRVTTDELPRRVELTHANLRKFGTVYNTLAAVCKVHGTMQAVARESDPGTGSPGRIETIELWPLSQGEIDGRRGRFAERIFTLPDGPPPDFSPTSRAGVGTRLVRGGFPATVLRADERRRTRRGRHAHPRSRPVATGSRGC